MKSDGFLMGIELIISRFVNFVLASFHQYESMSFSQRGLLCDGHCNLAYQVVQDFVMSS